MTAVAATFLNPIFPVFAIMLVGIVLARLGMFDFTAAQAINRFIFYVALPALIIKLLTSVSFAQFDIRVLAVYFGSELVVYAAATATGILLFGRDRGEAILLGMAACFVNHVFFVLPIATILFGETAVVLITAIIFIDTTVIFAGTIILLEVVSRGASSRLSVVRSFLRNPVLIAIVAGLVINGADIGLHPGIDTFTSFAGNAVAPAALFSLGVTLVSAGTMRFDRAAAAVTAIKVGGHPLAAVLLFFTVSGVAPQWRDLVLFTAAGPCGAMPFVLAMQYRVRADSIGLAIIYSTVVSLFTLAILA